jgi:hypothetical protein
VGEWLRTNTAPADSFGALEVGIIGYYAGRPVVDFAGLIQPQVAAQLAPNKTYEDAAIWASERFRPAYLVLAPGAFPRLEAGYIAQFCRVVQKFARVPYQAPTDIYIYQCGT